MTLRRTLIASVLGLIALAGVIIGVVSTIALNGYLVNQLDAQLREASNRTVMTIAGGSQAPRPGLSLGQPSGTVVAVVTGGEATIGYVLDQNGEAQALTAEQLSALDGVGGGSTGSARSASLGSPPESVSLPGSGRTGWSRRR